MNNNTFWHHITIFLTVFITIFIPIYWHYYGPQNFLWLSDIGLFLTVIGLWMQSSLLISMAAAGVLFVELLWNVDFFMHLFFNINITGLSAYMFNSSYPYALRALSLFHIIMPGIWILYLAQYGYDKRAIYYFTPLYWVIVLATYWFTQLEENINWVFWPTAHGIRHISPLVWVAILALGVPLLILLPTHYALRRLFNKCPDNW